MEEIKKLKTNKILGKYTGRVIHLLIGWRMNSLLGEKEEMEEEKKIIVLRIVSLLLQSITQSA